MPKAPKIEVNDQVLFLSGKEKETGKITEIITRQWIDENEVEHKARAYKLEDKDGSESWWESEKAEEKLFILSNDFDNYAFLEEETEETEDSENEDDEDFEEDDED